MLISRCVSRYPHGKHGRKKFIICFYLADNSIEVRDVRDTGDAKDAGSFPKFLKRQKLAKSRTGCADAFPSMTAAEKQNYFSPQADLYAMFDGVQSVEYTTCVGILVYKDLH